MVRISSMRSPFASIRRMISPVRPRVTASGLTIRRVASSGMGKNGLAGVRDSIERAGHQNEVLVRRFGPGGREGFAHGGVFLRLHARFATGLEHDIGCGGSRG